MKKSSKAACLSLFIFPGVGLLWLGRRARGLLFLIPALAAISYIFYKIFTTAYGVYSKLLRQVEEGNLVIDPTNITQIAQKIYGDIFSALAGEYQQLQSLEYFFIACWICSAFSSYFVGLQIEKQTENKTQ